MLEEHYPFVAQPLPYEYDALLPVLDEETLHFHHDKHYQTYVDKLNALSAKEKKNLLDEKFKERLIVSEKKSFWQKIFS